MDKIEEALEKTLPCTNQDCDLRGGGHYCNCAASYRSAVVEFCRGLVADKDGRIAELERELRNEE